MTCDANVTVKVKGDVTAEVDGHARITAKGEVKAESETGITLKAPYIKICGMLTVTNMDGAPGEGVLSGNYTIRNGGLAVPDKDVSAGAVSLRGHAHENSGGQGVGGRPVGG